MLNHSKLQNWVAQLIAKLKSQAGVVDINPAFHLYYKCCMWVELISTWLQGFSLGTPVSSLLKIDSIIHLAVVLCSEVKHGSWSGAESLASSTAPSVWLRWASNSVYDWEKGQLASQVKRIKAGIGRHHLRKKTIQFYSVPDKTQALQPLLNARSLGILCHKSLTWALIFQKTCNWKYIFLSRLGAESQENSYTDKFEDLLRRWSIVHY